MEVNIHHAKTNLSRLILQAEAGDEVIIARAGKPAVKLVPVDASARRMYKPGALKGRLQLPADFFDPNPTLEKEMEQLFYASPILSPDPHTVAAEAQESKAR
jgi:prevent-host-death family protein